MRSSTTPATIGHCHSPRSAPAWTASAMRVRTPSRYKPYPRRSGRIRLAANVAIEAVSAELAALFVEGIVLGPCWAACYRPPCSISWRGGWPCSNADSTRNSTSASSMTKRNDGAWRGPRCSTMRF